MTRNLAPVLMLLALAGCAKKEGWMEVGRVGAGILYADAATLVRSGSGATGQTLIDFRSAQTAAGSQGGAPHLSAKVENEYDCAKQQWRTLSITYYSGNMGGGDVISVALDPGAWKPAVSGSVGGTLLDAACAKS